MYETVYGAERREEKLGRYLQKAEIKWTHTINLCRLCNQWTAEVKHADQTTRLANQNPKFLGLMGRVWSFRLRLCCILCYHVCERLLQWIPPPWLAEDKGWCLGCVSTTESNLFGSTTILRDLRQQWRHQHFTSHQFHAPCIQHPQLASGSGSNSRAP